MTFTLVHGRTPSLLTEREHADVGFSVAIRGFGYRRISENDSLIWEINRLDRRKPARHDSDPFGIDFTQ